MQLRRILMAEDESDIRDVARLALEAVGGFEVNICESGQAALAAATDFAPDLILLDVMMSGMDGPTTLLELRKMANFAHTPIVFMTAKVQPSEIAHFKSLGALDVIAKPFDPMLLSEQIETIWRNFQDKVRS